MAANHITMNRPIGVIFDFDANGKVIGIDFENATEFTDVENLPPLPAE